MGCIWRCVAVCVLGLAVRQMSRAQVTVAPGQSTPKESKTVETVPRVPGITTLFRGFNAGVSATAVHDSTIGWYSVLTPAVSYTFSNRWSGDASTSIYFHRLVENQNPATVITQLLVNPGYSPGDTVIGFHGTFFPGALLDVASVYLTAPTGDRRAGLGTGNVTFDASNHMERYYKGLGFLLDLGVGNSSNVFNSVLNRNYSSYGGLADFQAGAILWLRHRVYWENVWYEELPVGGQTVYRSADEGEAPEPVVTGSHFAEDNGYIGFVGKSLNDHWTVSGYYNRSVRRQADTVSFGITYVLRSPESTREDSLIDRAIREAEKP